MGATTLRECTTALCDIRAALTKANIRALAEYAVNTAEHRYLSYICSRQGSAAYMERLLARGLGILALLKFCPSCAVSVERVLELLPPLKPRRYSAASSPLETPGKVRFILNVDAGLALDPPGHAGAGVGRLGRGRVRHMQRVRIECEASGTTHQADPPAGVLARSILAAKQHPGLPRVLLYKEVNAAGNFHPPADPAVPFIMIGPGTGIAPFLGFLSHRHDQRRGPGRRVRRDLALLWEPEREEGRALPGRA